MGFPTWREIGVGAVAVGFANYAFGALRSQSFGKKLLAGASCMALGGTICYQSSIYTSFKQWLRGGRIASDPCDAPLTRSRVYTALSGVGLLVFGVATCAYSFLDAASQEANVVEAELNILQALQQCKAARMLMQKVGVSKTIRIGYGMDEQLLNAGARYDAASHSLTLLRNLSPEGQLGYSLDALCKHDLSEKIRAIATQAEQGTISSFIEFVKKITTIGWEAASCQRETALSCRKEKGWNASIAFPPNEPTLEATIAKILKDERSPAFLAVKAQWDALTSRLFCEQNPGSPSCIGHVLQAIDANVTS